MIRRTTKFFSIQEWVCDGIERSDNIFLIGYSKRASRRSCHRNSSLFCNELSTFHKKIILYKPNSTISLSMHSAESESTTIPSNLNRFFTHSSFFPELRISTNYGSFFDSLTINEFVSFENDESFIFFTSHGFGNIHFVIAHSYETFVHWFRCGFFFWRAKNHWLIDTNHLQELNIW